MASPPKYDLKDWLPTSIKEVRALGWDYIDIIYFSGDAYVDHPSFGTAVIGRLLQQAGYRVAIVPQPNWKDDLRDFKKLGEPRMFFGVSAGSMDSMVNHYTANIRLRSDDAYTAGGKAGFRPDYAVSVYSRILKQLYPHVPVVIGGIEASLRRFAHYDYWSDSVKPSILVESMADLLVYGMGDRAILEVAKMLSNGFNAKLLRKLKQVAFLADSSYVGKLAAEHTIILVDPMKGENLASNFSVIETQSNRMEQDKVLVEPVSEGKYVVVNPPYEALTGDQLDNSFELPYTRLPHPRYSGKGAIPAYEMIKHSINIHRGCFGGCSFCTISAHQGKFIISRSERSVMDEINKVVAMGDFKGYISDIGGPSANMYGMGGKDMVLCAKCAKPSCLFPVVCRNLDNDHSRLIGLYHRANSHKAVKKAFVGSGIRYDLIPDNQRKEYLRELIVNHTSGRLKVAPEHTEDHVLRLMRKPPFADFERLNNDFNDICHEQGLNYQLIPYFISSHPGCTESDMRCLAGHTGRLHFNLEQVQDFTPTPMTLSSIMYHTGRDTGSGEKLFVARDQEAKKRQKSWFFRKK